MKLNKFLGFVLALSVVGCTNDLVDEGIATNNDAVLGNATDAELVITASMDEESSKAVTALKNEGKTVTALFDQGDQIGAYLFNTELDFAHLNLKFEALDGPVDVDNDGIKDKIDFKAMEQSILLQPGSGIYAYYPFNNGNTIIEGTTKSAAAVGGWDGTRTFQFETTQAMNGPGDYTFLDNNVVLVSKLNTITMGEDNSYKADLAFRFANSFITVNLKNDFDNEIKVNRVKIRVKSADYASGYAPLTGKFVYDFANSSDFSDSPFVDVKEGKDYVEVKLENGDVVLQPGEKAFVTAVVAPVNNFDGYVVEVYTTDGVYGNGDPKEYYFRYEKPAETVLTPAKNVRVGGANGISLNTANRYDDKYVHIFDAETLYKYMKYGAEDGAKIVFDNDIDAGAIDTEISDYQPDGQRFLGFEGHVIDGNDCTISNLKYRGTMYAGFVAYGKNVTVKNLKFKDCHFKAATDGDNHAFVGTVFGSVDGGSVNNVTVNGGSVSGLNKVGGLIGYSGTCGGDLNVNNCVVKGTEVVSGTPADKGSTEEHGSVGGLIGFVQTDNNTSVNNVNITNTKVDGVKVNTEKSRYDRHNGLYVGTYFGGGESTGKLTITGATIEGGEFTETYSSVNAINAYQKLSPYWVDGFEGKKALVGGLRGEYGKVEIEDYVFEGTKPGVKDGKYHIFNELNFLNLTENFGYVDATSTPLDKDVILRNEIKAAAETTFKPIYLKSQDAGLNNADWYTFDGNGKTLFNAKFAKHGDNASMFAHLGGNLKVKNISLDGVQVEAATGYAGILVAQTHGDLTAEGVKFTNCVATGDRKVGLVAGFNTETCELNVTNLSIGKGNELNANQAQVGAIVGYTYDSTVINNVTFATDAFVTINPYDASLWNGATTTTIPGYIAGGEKEGRTFGAYVGTLGTKHVDGTNIVMIDVPAVDTQFKVGDKLMTAYEAQFNLNSFNYYVGGWDKGVTEDNTAIINDSKPFHAAAYNLWNAETLRLRGAQFDTRNLYVTHNIDYDGKDFVTMLARNNVFDGQGCTIENINYVEAPWKEKTDAEYGPNNKGDLGLFTLARRKFSNTDITSHANVVVRNLTLKNVTALNGNYVSAVLAQANDDITGYNDFTTTLIENVHVIGGELSGYSRTGGLVAFIGNLDSGGTTTSTVEIKNSSVQGVEMTNNIDPTSEHIDTPFDGGKIGGLVGLVNKGALTIDNSFVKNITIDLRGTEKEANQANGYCAAGYLVGVFAGGKDTRSITITNSYVDNAIDAATPWKVNRVGSKIISTYGDDYALGIANNTEYTTYGTLLGGWKNDLGSVKINGIEYDKAYKGIYSIQAHKDSVIVTNATNSSEEAWFGSIKQAYDRANDTTKKETIEIYSNYDAGRNYYEPYTKFEGDIVTLNLYEATVHGQLDVHAAELTINDADNYTTTFTNKGYDATVHTSGSYPGLIGAAIVATANGKLEIENATFDIEGGKNAIAVSNYTGSKDMSTAAGTQYWVINITNCTFNNDAAIAFERPLEATLFGNTFNNIATYAIKSFQGDQFIYAQKNVFNGETGKPAFLFGDRSSGSTTKVLLGAGDNTDNNTYTTGMKKHAGMNADVVEFDDYIVSIVAAESAAMRK